MSRRAPLLALGGLLACYLLLPVAAFVVRVARRPVGAGFSNPGLFEALAVSLVTATISLAIVTLVGLPLAYLLARSRSRLAGLLGVLVQLPLALPPVMSGILLVYLVGPYTGIGRLLGGRLTESLAGIVLAQTFVASPFLVVTARSAFRAIDPALFDLATTLGRREPRRFATVAVPIALDGIGAGMLLCWLRAFGEYGATVILAYHPYSLPVFTDVQFGGTGLQLTSAPTALALAVAAVVLGAAHLRRPRRRGRRRVASGGGAGAPAGVARLGEHKAGGPPAPGAGASAKPPAAPVSGVSPAPARRLELRIDARFGEFSLRVAAGSPTGRLAVVGPSGSGKSATLRSIAGLVPQAEGAVLLGGEDLAALPADRRGVGYVTQGLALFPHLDVAGQVRFGAGAEPGLGSWWLQRLGIGDLLDRRPDELSGGQRQRVRLAQALACSPRLLLLDEPLSALDVPVRAGLRQQLRELQRTTGVATVIVTHDPAEAALLADDVVVLSAGRVLQAGSRREVFDRPASAEVAALLGWTNLHRGRVVAPGVVSLGAGAGVGAGAGAVRLDLVTADLAVGAPVTVGVAPGGAVLAPAAAAAPGGAGAGAPAGSPSRRLAAVVEDVIETGASAEVVAVVGSSLVLRVATGGAAAGAGLGVGDLIEVVIDLSTVRLWGETPRSAADA